MKRLYVFISVFIGVIVLISVFLALNTTYFDGNKTLKYINKNPVVKYIKKDVISKNWDNIVKKQRELTSRIWKTMKKTDSEKFLFYFFISIGLSFLYGVIHSLGPGHGKMVVMSYFLSEKAKPWEAPVMALQVSTAHIASAIILVLFVNVSLRQAVTGSVENIHWIKVVSYSLITLVGFALLFKKLFEKKLKEKMININRGILAVAAGMIPCTGALLILLFAMANNALVVGIFLVIAIGLGIMTTLSILGLITLYTKKLAGRETFFTKGKNISVALEYIGACLIIVLGTIMLTLNTGLPALFIIGCLILITIVLMFLLKIAE